MEKTIQIEKSEIAQQIMKYRKWLERVTSKEAEEYMRGRTVNERYELQRGIMEAREALQLLKSEMAMILNAEYLRTCAEETRTEESQDEEELPQEELVSEEEEELCPQSETHERQEQEPRVCLEEESSQEEEEENQSEGGELLFVTKQHPKETALMIDKNGEKERHGMIMNQRSDKNHGMMIHQRNELLPVRRTLKKVDLAGTPHDPGGGKNLKGHGKEMEIKHRTSEIWDCKGRCWRLPKNRKARRKDKRNRVRRGKSRRWQIDEMG
jgi:hypothetical protein